MTPEEIVERWLEGTNLGRFQTVTFQLRFIGTFSPDERDTLWDEDVLLSANLLPGRDEMVVYFGEDEETYISFPNQEDNTKDDFYHIHTTFPSGGFQDWIRLRIDVIRMWWRTRR